MLIDTAVCRIGANSGREEEGELHMIRKRILLTTVGLLSNVSCTVADNAEPLMQ